MRRKDRQITDRKAIDDIIRRSHVCRLGMCDDGQPYVVPLNFGYDGHSLYFHGATEGRKIDVLKRNNRVCFEFDTPEEVIPADQACRWSTKYESVIGFGTARIVEDLETKRQALGWIMRQHSREDWIFPEKNVNAILVIRVDIEQVTGKAQR